MLGCLSILSITALGSVAASSTRWRWKTGWRSCEKDWGWSQKIPIFCRYGVPRSKLKAARLNVSSLAKPKLLSRTVSAVEEAAGRVVLMSPVQSSVVKEVRETDEPGRGQGKVCTRRG